MIINNYWSLCMKKSFKIFSALILSSTMAFGLGATIFATTNKSIKEVKAAVDYSACQTAHNSNNASSLISALRSVTSTGTSGSYAGLWTTYTKAFIRSDGYIKDYYSSISKFTTANQDNGSGGTTEGDKYNREHSIPKSWWGGTTSSGTQGADPFIVIPADKLVNNKRSNYPLGKVSSVTFASSGDYSKLGSADTSYGYTGTVFEPNDEVKGDLARIHFYAIAKYSESYGWTTGNGSSTFSGSSTKNYGLTDYAVKLFTAWNELDPPDDWERSVNTALYGIQGNTNPFIDHPEYANTLWGNVSGATTYTGSGGTTPSVGITSISKTTASLTVGGNTTISATSSNGGTISWSSSDTSVATVSSTTAASGSDVTITAQSEGSATITASIIIDSTTYSKSCSVTVSSSGGQSSGDYTLITSTSSLSTGDYVVVKTESGTGVTGWNNNKDATVSSTESSWVRYLVTKSENTFTLEDTGESSFIALPTSNHFKYSSSGGSCSVDTSGHLVSNNRYLCANGTNYRFYTSIGDYSPFFVYKVNTSTAKTLSSISVKTAPTKTSYTAGETFSPAGLVISALYSDSSSEDITYSSTTQSGFTFNPSTSTALTVSNTSVTITYGGKSCMQAITVSASTNPTVNSVTVSPSTLSLNVNGTNTLSATVSVSNGADQTVTWSSDNESVATVDNTGKVTAVAAGTAKITATSTFDTSKKGTCTVTVTNGSTTQPQHAGTQEDPYTTADAKLVMDNTGSGVVYQTEVYVSMVPTSSSYDTTYSKYTCVDSNMTISSASLSFTPNGTYTNANALVGKTVVAKGYIELYNGVYQMGYLPVSASPTGSKYNPTIISITPDTSGSGGSGSGDNTPSAQYVFSSNTTKYNATPTFADVTTNFDSNIFTVSLMNNVRVGSSASSGSGGGNTDYMFYPTGGSSASLTIALNNIDYIVSKVSIQGCKNAEAEAPVMTCGNVSKTVIDLSNKGTYNYYPLDSQFTIEVSTNRVFVSSITLTIIPATDEHLGWGTSFLEMTATECAAGQGISSETWSDCETIFNKNVDSNTRVDILGYTANASGDACAEAVARYDNIIANYNLSDFAVRGNGANRMNLFKGTATNNILLILGSISLLGGLTYLAYFLKKRKEN